MKSSIKTFMAKNKTTIDIFGIVVTIVSTAVSIYVFLIAKNADREIKESTARIEELAIRIDSATAKIDSVTARIENSVAYVKEETTATKKFIAELRVKQLAPIRNSPYSPDVEPSNQAVNDWFMKGCDAANNGKYREAIENFKKVIDKEPKHARAYYNLAIVNYKLYHDIDNAVPYLKKAAQLGYSEARKLLKNNGYGWEQ
jgi:tetratricopeptide (TPR) repeat protein